MAGFTEILDEGFGGWREIFSHTFKIIGSKSRKLSSGTWATCMHIFRSEQHCPCRGVGLNRLDDGCRGGRV